MSWKYVFNTDLTSYTNVDKAAEQAYISGYKFFAWNDTIFFLISKTNYANTYISRKDLF